MEPEVQSNAEITNESPAQEGQSISSMVNQEFATILQQMGFTKAVSEKALFLTQNASVEAGVEWIQQNQDQPDFNEELRIVGQEEKSKLSKEEAAQRAKELQARLREQRIQKDKELEMQQEKDRLRVAKELSMAKVQFEEAERKRAIEQQLREKKKYAEEMKQMQEILKKDREARFGKQVTAR
jgi:uncharacterized UBP type Zn finger protein